MRAEFDHNKLERERETHVNSISDLIQVVEESALETTGSLLEGRLLSAAILKKMIKKRDERVWVHFDAIA